jgi:threonine synthase
VWRAVCTRCGRVWSLARAPGLGPCGGLLDAVGPLADPTGDYGRALPPGARVAGPTPVSEVGVGTFVKAEFQHRTGSFKDRGAAAMIGTAAASGVRSVVADSSGNAGRAVAAYAADAGMECTVFVPTGTAPDKLAAIGGFGATVVEVPGGRPAAAGAARDRVGEGGGWYASHVHRPAFHHGVKTLALELFEQVPDIDAVVVPAGNGTLVLGLWLGFGLLAALGHLARVPRIVAVQAERCAPLLGRSPSGLPTAAAGIAIPDPPRAEPVRAAVAASGGRLIAVSEAGIERAREDLGGLGFEVEPTGAVAWAARAEVGGGRVVFVLTGR